MSSSPPASATSGRWRRCTSIPVLGSVSEYVLPPMWWRHLDPPAQLAGDPLGHGEAEESEPTTIRSGLETTHGNRGEPMGVWLTVVGPQHVPLLDAVGRP